MPSFRKATNRLEVASLARIPGRDRRIIAVGREIDRWTQSLEERLLGIVAAGRGGIEGVMASTDVVLADALAEAAEILDSGLRGIHAWAWQDVTATFVRVIPMRFWLHRLVPVTMHGEIGEGAVQEFDFRTVVAWDRILRGLASATEAREIVRQAEFGDPTPEQVDAIMASTEAPDGLSATDRIKTILPADMEKLRGIVRETMTTDFKGASAVEAMKVKIAPLLDTNEGINWKAKRIARTEGVRVAEAAMQDSWEPVKDLLKGIRTFTANDENVRSEHRVWHDLLYIRTSDGSYRQTTRPRAPGLLPHFPAAPNCRCYSTQELRDDLYVGAPPVNWGQYEKGMARFRQQEKAALAS
jgi:hypothetical protein